jgi:hypothetical protein
VISVVIGSIILVVSTVRIELSSLALGIFLLRLFLDF